MPKNEWIIEDSPAPIIAKPTTKQELAGVPVQAARGLEDFVNFLGHLFGEPSMPGYQPPIDLEDPYEFRGLSGAVQKGLNVPEEALQPEGLVTSGLQRFARSAAPAATLGGALSGLPGVLSALTTTGLGAGAATGAKALGAPESIQDIAQLGTELGYGLKSGKIPTVSKQQKIEDTLARAAVKPGTQASAEAISKSLHEVGNKLATEVSEKSAKKIRHALETVSNNMTRGKINPVDAMDLRKKLYSLTKELPTNVSAEYIEPLTKGINNFFAVYAAENPKFYKHLNARDKLTTIKHMNSVLADTIDHLQLGGSVLGKAAKSIVNKIIGPVERVVRGVVSGKQTNVELAKQGLENLGSSERFIKALVGNSAGRKVYFNMVQAAAKNDPALFIKYANQLTKAIPELKEDLANEWIIED